MPFGYNLVKSAMAIAKEPLMITRTVKELVYGGYEPKLFTVIREILPESFKKQFPRLVPPPMFGLLYDVSYS